MGNFQAYSSDQLNQLQNDINKINADTASNASFEQTQLDVGQFYKDQASYNLSAYPEIAYAVSQNIGFNGITANANLVSGIPSGQDVSATELKVMTRLATLDMDAIISNNGVPASITQLSEMHVTAYGEANVSITNWSGIDFAVANLAWIPNATASDLRDVTEQSSHIPNYSAETQTQAFFNLALAANAGASMTLEDLQAPVLPIILNISDDIQFVKDVGLMGQLLVNDGYSLYNYLTSHNTDGNTTLSLAKDSQGNIAVSATDSASGASMQYNFDGAGNVTTTTIGMNGKYYIGVFHGDANITADNSIVDIHSSGTVTINGTGNDVTNLGGANTLVVSGNNNTVNASTGSTTFINGINNGFNGASANSVLALGANSTAQVNGTGVSIELLADGAGVTTTQDGNSVDDWAGNNFVNGANQKINLNTDTVSPGTKQIMTVTGDGNSINASDGSKTFSTGQNNNFNGSQNGALVAVAKDSSVNVSGSGQQVELLDDQSRANFSQTGNSVDVWGSNDEVDGVGGQAITQGPSASNFHNNTQSNVQYAEVYGPDGRPVPMSPGGSTTIDYTGTVTIGGVTKHPHVTQTDTAGYVDGDEDEGGDGDSGPSQENSVDDDPIVVSFDSNQITTTPASAGIPSIHDGQLSTMGWITPGEGVLMQVGSDNSLSAVKSFASLSTMDTDGDKQISSNDTAWSSLRLLTTDSLGVEKLVTMSQAGVEDISLQASPEYRYDNGNLISAQSVVSLEDGKYGMAADVTFQGQVVSTDQFVSDFKNSIKQTLSNAANNILQDYQNKVTAPTSTNDNLSFFKDETTVGSSAGSYLTDIGDHSKIALPAIFSHGGS